MQRPRPPADRIEAIRRYNRFYTKRIGVLGEGLLRSPFSLTQARVLYELAQRGETTGSDLVAALGIDPGYASRLLRGLERKGLVRKRPSKSDGRRTLVSLSAAGKRSFARLDARSRDDVAGLLASLPPEDQTSLVGAMQTIERLLSEPDPTRVPYLLRPPEPGDLGWVIHRHGALYAREWGYDESFEALVAQIVADFVRQFDARRERCWIAEREGERVGSVALVRDPEDDDVAKLRLLLVEPRARGLGIGARLIDECLRFATSRGYSRLRLWTHSELLAARRLYTAAGFACTASEPYTSFGRKLVSETWERALGPAAGTG